MDTAKKPPKVFIDAQDPKARRLWADRLGVTEARLRRSVRLVGPRASTVLAYLGIKRGEDVGLRA